MIDRAIRVHYEQGQERERLIRDGGTLELVRTQKLLRRYLPPPPATVLDVGGGPGTYTSERVLRRGSWKGPACSENRICPRPGNTRFHPSAVARRAMGTC